MAAAQMSSKLKSEPLALCSTSEGVLNTLLGMLLSPAEILKLPVIAQLSQLIVKSVVLRVVLIIP